MTQFLPQSYRHSFKMFIGVMDVFDFLEVKIAVETESWEETEGGLLSFKTPQLGVFSNTGEEKKITAMCKDTTSSCSSKRKKV